MYMAYESHSLLPASVTFKALFPRYELALLLMQFVTSGVHA